MSKDIKDDSHDENNQDMNIQMNADKNGRWGYDVDRQSN